LLSEVTTNAFPSTIGAEQLTWLVEVISNQVMYGSYVAGVLRSDDREHFVEMGIARHKRGEGVGEDGDMEIVIDEPLPILAAWRWLYNHRFRALYSYISANVGSHSQWQNGFERHLSFYLQHVFDEAHTLDSIFDFRADKQFAWQSETFELVTIYNDDDGIKCISVRSTSGGPSFTSGCKPPSEKDVIEWLENNSQRATFCFPPPDIGPDIFFFGRSKASGGLMLFAAQCKNIQRRLMRKADLIKAVRSVTPEWFSKKKGAEVNLF
jgi:hypothetical protein